MGYQDSQISMRSMRSRRLIVGSTLWKPRFTGFINRITMDGLFTVKRAKTNSNLIYLVNKINLKPENYYPHKLVFLLIFLAKWSLRIFRKRFSKLTLFHIPVRAKQTRQHFVTADLQPLVRVTFMVHSSPHYLTILLLTILLVLFNNSSED